MIKVVIILFSLLSLTALPFLHSLESLNILFAITIFYYIVFFYNSKKIYKKLGYFTPMVILFVYFVETYYLGQFTYFSIAELGLTHYRSNEAVVITAKIYNLSFLIFLIIFLIVSLLSNKILNIIRETHVLNRKNAYSILFVIFFFALTATLIFYKLRGVPMLLDNVEEGRIKAVKGANYLFMLILQFISFSMLAIAFFYPKRKILLFFLVGISAMFLLSMGYRSPVGAIIIFFIMWYSFSIKRIGFLKGFIVMHLLFYAGVLTGILRNMLSGHTNFDFAVHWLISSHVQFREIAFAIDVLQEKLFGSTYYAGLVLFIPSSFYPEKPNGMGLFLKETLYDEKYQGGGIRVSQLGEAYLNFDYIGVIVMSIFSAIALYYLTKYLYKTQKFYRNDKYKLFMSIILFNMVFSFIYTDFAGAVFSFFRDFMILYFVNKLSYRKRVFYD